MGSDFHLSLQNWGAGLAQWWERSPPTNVSRVRFSDPASYVGWVCCWFSTVLREVFLQVLRFSPLLKNQNFQIPIRPGNARPRLNEFFELLGAPFIFYKIFRPISVGKTTLMWANRLKRCRWDSSCRRSDLDLGESTYRRNDWHPIDPTMLYLSEGGGPWYILFPSI